MSFLYYPNSDVNAINTIDDVDDGDDGNVGDDDIALYFAVGRREIVDLFGWWCKYIKVVKMTTTLPAMI